MKPPCICVYAVQHPREARVVRTVGCPQHPGTTTGRLAGLPPWAEQKKPAGP